MKSIEIDGFLQKLAGVKIILIGYMGSGKTTIGKMLSKRLNFNFLDLDDYIEEAEGMSVREIFKNRGEVYFRKRETEYLRQVLEGNEDVVLSVGGGTPCFGTNMQLINDATPNSIYIKTDLNVLCDRLLREKEGRPLIANLAPEDFQEFIAKHLFERSFFYNQAHHTVHNQNKSVEDVVLEIQKILV
ncbi:shikimate kinase [Maribacter sp. 4G9]|uniref:shikimate kinase n=1 Tax=Maribacter sp. 4G9 TaxID=1889777 RepID=UPI0026D93804|nr:shikimate kinase [Maribacter sp. 4G9]